MSELRDKIASAVEQVLIDEKVIDSNIDRPSASEFKPQDWCPFAEIVDFRLKTRGKYRKGWPEGVVIHFTAGWDHKDSKAVDALKLGQKNGYTYVSMDRSGNIYQASPISEWGYHAGQSYHYKLGTGVSEYLLGIEICNPGRLTEKNGRLFSWFGAEYSIEECRYTEKPIGNIQPGWYRSFSKEQEESLTRFILWLKKCNPSVFDLNLVCGHDSICKPLGRKNDPGFALSRSIPEYVEYVKLRYKQD